MLEEIQSLKSEALAQTLEAKSVEELEQIRVAYLGRNGKLTDLIKKISKLPEQNRKEIGRLVNEVKENLVNHIASKKNSLTSAAREWFDPTIPGKKPSRGHLHLITQAIEEISKIFEKIGFTRVRYPEVDWDWYAFESLNMPKEHPARDEWETFIVDSKPDKKFGKIVLTPHTTNAQVREMKRTKPPIRMINIGKCYRRQSDVTHVPMFHQFDGLVIDEGINITHLKGTLDHFAKQFYGSSITSRIRPFNFRFTEPSFEVDFSCVHCGGRGCRFCKSGWHEAGGAGMVHPNVLKSGKLDPNKYQGFAFGWGVERVMMLKKGLGIDDVRTMYSTDLRFLRQF